MKIGNTLETQLSRAWQQAADDIGFVWIPHFHWVSPDSRRHTYLGLVKGLGRPGGTLVRLLQLGEFSGISVLDENYLLAKIGDRYAQYHRPLWQETLAKWGNPE